jgi:hypothetical protein
VREFVKLPSSTLKPPETRRKKQRWRNVGPALSGQAGNGPYYIYIYKYIYIYMSVLMVCDI